jgi:hypothetical protein
MFILRTTWSPRKIAGKERLRELGLGSVFRITLVVACNYIIKHIHCNVPVDGYLTDKGVKPHNKTGPTSSLCKGALGTLRQGYSI